MFYLNTSASDMLLPLNSHCLPCILALVIFLLTLPESELFWGVYIILLIYTKSGVN